MEASYKLAVVAEAVATSNQRTFVRYHSADVASGPRSPKMNRTAYVISAQHKAL